MGKRGAAPEQGKLPADLVKRFKSCITARETKDADLLALHKKYKEGSFETKKEILEKFETDTKMKFVSQYLKEQSESKEIEERKSGTWMTDKQIAKEEALDLNDEDDKKELEVLLGDLEQRDHPVKAWADLGKKQYKYFQDSSATTTKSSERHSWLESACGKESQPKAKAVTNAADANTTGVVVDWSVACKKVVVNIDHALGVFGKQEVLFAKLKNDKNLDASEKEGMQPKMDEVNQVLAVVKDAKANYTEDEAGHGVLKEAMKIFGGKLDAAIAENNRVKELKAQKKSK